MVSGCLVGAEAVERGGHVNHLHAGGGFFGDDEPVLFPTCERAAAGLGGPESGALDPRGEQGEVGDVCRAPGGERVTAARRGGRCGVFYTWYAGKGSCGVCRHGGGMQVRG